MVWWTSVHNKAAMKSGLELCLLQWGMMRCFLCYGSSSSNVFSEEFAFLWTFCSDVRCWKGGHFLSVNTSEEKFVAGGHLLQCLRQISGSGWIILPWENTFMLQLLQPRGKFYPSCAVCILFPDFVYSHCLCLLSVCVCSNWIKSIEIRQWCLGTTDS